MKEKFLLISTMVMIFTSSKIQATFYSTQNDPTSVLFEHLQFTRSGLQNFFKHKFNNNEYTEIMSYTGGFQHFLEFWEYGVKTNQPREYFASVIRVFYNRAKGIQYITIGAIEEFLSKALIIMKSQEEISIEKWLDEQKNSATQFAYNYFQTNLVKLPKNPAKFVENMTTGIIDHLKQTFVPETTTARELELSLVRLIDVLLTRIAWNVGSQEDAWNSLSRVSNLIKTLSTQRIIQKIDAEDLFYSLLEAFLKFLNLVGAEFSLETIITMQRNVEDGPAFWEFVEQDEQLAPIKDRLISALLQTEAVIRGQSEAKFIQMQGSNIIPLELIS